TNGTTSDFDGNYSLNNVSTGNTILFSYVGFVAQEITYSGHPTIDIILAEDASELEQVVLIGYGTTRKKDLTGSIALVTSED
ncbi:carboxypeptidase-like regulatory domain-containing protein, partial [Aquimarina celericrescens]|nr:carboxypeptidase-like regulatory domain-containing protein [Aquimarina celericrescens]